MKFPFALGSAFATCARDMFLHVGLRKGLCKAQHVQSIRSAHCSGPIRRRSRSGLRALQRSNHRAFCFPTKCHNARPCAGGPLSGLELGCNPCYLRDQAWRGPQKFDHQALAHAGTQRLAPQRQQALGGRQGHSDPERPILGHPRLP
jgi:hypothetical protein